MSLISQIAEGVTKALLPWAQEHLLPVVNRKIDEMGDKLIDIAKAKMDEMAAKALALIPLAVGSALKLGLEQVLDRIPGVEVPPLNVQDLAEVARGDLNKIPDIDIPILSDVFDLTDFLKGLGGR